MIALQSGEFKEIDYKLPGRTILEKSIKNLHTSLYENKIISGF